MFSQKLLFIKYFHKTLFVGLLELASLRVEIPIEVRLPTAGSPQTPRKRDPHWELLLLLLLLNIITGAPMNMELLESLPLSIPYNPLCFELNPPLL